MKQRQCPSKHKAPAKLWYGKSRLAKSYMGYSKNILEWAITIRPSDWIATCEGCNRQVAKIEYKWSNVGESSGKLRDNKWVRGRRNGTWVLHEVWFTDTRGGFHCCPGGGCALPKESIQEIEEYHKSWIKGLDDYNSDYMPWSSPKFVAQLKRMKEVFDSGGTIVDENGEFLPEFDHKDRSCTRVP